jgi:hypothetical protein
MIAFKTRLALAMVVSIPLFATVRAQDATTQPADDEDRDALIERLRGEAGDDGVLTRILRNMQRAQERLSVRFDAGEDTQRIQAQILQDLDEAIRTAKQMQSSGKRSTQKSEPRRAGRRLEPGATADGRPDATSASGEEGAPMRGTVTEPRLGGPIEDTARGWGHLPERDREAVIQGMDEKHRQQYEESIRRYYESLAEPKRDE